MIIPADEQPMNRHPDLEKQVAGLYDKRLPYHNFGHVLRVIEAGEKILAQCRIEGIAVDDEIVYYAILLHDAGFHEDHRSLGFASKEAYSAHLAGELLQERGVGKDVITRVQAAILGTHVDAHCRSNEDKLVRLADLSGMAADYPRFKADTLALKCEAEMLNGGRIGWEEWKAQAGTRINEYLQQDLDLLSDYYDADGNSIFRRKVQDNVDRLKADAVAG